MVALLRVQLPAAFCLPYLSLTPDFFSCSYFGRLRVKNWNWNWNLTQLVSRFVYLLCSKARLFLCLARTLPCSFLPVLSHPFLPPPLAYLSLHLSRPLPSQSFAFVQCLCRPCSHFICFPLFFYLSHFHCISKVSYCISEPNTPPPHPLFLSFPQLPFSLSPSPTPAAIIMVLPFHFRSYYPALILLLIALHLPLSETFSLPPALHFSSTFPVSHPVH